MPEQEYESHLFIGGIVDGQWFSVPKTARRWTLPVIAIGNINDYKKDLSDMPPEVSAPQEHTYYRTKLAECLTNKVFVFVSEEIYTDKYDRPYPSYHDDSGWKIMCKLVNNYKVIR